MSNWTQNPFPVAPWDALGLPPRTLEERCARHKHCGYRDDDPNRCPICHAAPAKCRGEHGGAPLREWRNRTATATSPVLRAGQHDNPRIEAQRRLDTPTPPDSGSECVPSTIPSTLQEIAA